MAVGEQDDEDEGGERYARPFRDGEQMGLTDIGSERVVMTLGRCEQKTRPHRGAAWHGRAWKEQRDAARLSATAK